MRKGMRSVTETKQAAVQSACSNMCIMTQLATILLAPQRKGYGVCGAVPPELYVTTAANLSITSTADAGASALNSSVADVPCPGAPLVRG
jgi:hypothetical protein